MIALYEYIIIHQVKILHMHVCIIIDKDKFYSGCLIAASTNEVGFHVGPALTFPIQSQVPIWAQLGVWEYCKWRFLLKEMLPLVLHHIPQLYSLFNWSNIGKIPCLRKQHHLWIEPGYSGSQADPKRLLSLPRTTIIIIFTYSISLVATLCLI